MIGDLLFGIGSADLARANDIFRFMPSSVTVSKPEYIPYGFDVCAWLLQCIADELFNTHNVRVDVHCNYIASSFDYSEKTQKRVESLDAQGDEVANFILRH